ncbi:DUF3231 family protein [Ornithinibacillus contaminans]|uniref:DUF3231 family protein n=1 Tax=Ornithinibacillus contaminans TaxID=694055 RepID=UPI00064DD5CC|nr:DUF3231 family protein [Ornithinibacillus contaminans]
METNHHARLTSTEITQIWTNYVNDSMAICVLKYFLNTVEDEDIKLVVKYALELAETHLPKLETFFQAEDYPVPIGFNENEDVDINAPRLYSDSYMLIYIRDMAQVGMNNYTVAMAFSAREDVYDYFSENLFEANKLHKMSLKLTLSKGLNERPPYLSPPNKADYVKKQSFLTGWFGDRRPLNGMEISNLFSNILRSALDIATLISFAQVANSKEVREYMERGKEIASKHVEVLGSVMRESDLPIPKTLETEITDNNSFVFSDKLIMFHITTLNAAVLGYNGVSLASSHRRDIAQQYTRLSTEMLKYCEDGANIMIDNGWLEEPPMASDRQQLADG